MNRFWAILFVLIPLLGALVYATAIWEVGPLAGFWLPDNYSQEGEAIDQLFDETHWLIGIVFVLTTTLLAWVLWRYPNTRPEPASPRRGHVPLEVIWTTIPALFADRPGVLST